LKWVTYGAQAAAEHWYRKDAKDLTPIQAAGIAATNPRKFTATSSSSHINRKRKIMRVMRTVGKIKY
jgi:monofunctional biosynthetic peptidoglycan transglycosylase